MMSLFANPIVLAAIGICIVLFAYYMMIFIRPIKKVLLLRLRDYRGQDLTVSQETDLGLFCKAVKGVTHRFIKVGPAWVFHEGGRMITRFIGIEGTAYTGLIKGDGTVNVSVKDFLVFLWGEVFYNGIPKEQRDKVENDVIGITVAVERGDEEDSGLPTLTASDINDENEAVVLNKLADPSDKKTGDTFMKTVINFLLGASVMYFAIHQGWL